jgi:pimeloyl-ACP methyl ester carboxylesterase
MMTYMAMLELGPVRLHYELIGAGDPVLLIAPGGMRSANDLWASRIAWNPLERLRDQFQLIAMDQRNAGASSAPVAATDGWVTYATDQLALLDHLGIDECQVLGGCIGGPFIMALLAIAPERFRSGVILQCAGIDDNTDDFRGLFDAWATELAPTHPEIDAAGWTSFRENMWGGEFLLAATREQVAACTTPLLLLMGDDLFHPESVSRELAALAPNATLVERWKDGEDLHRADETIKRFLADHAAR